MGRAIMYEEIRIPVEIKLVKSPDGKTKLKATIPASIMFDKSFNAELLEKELITIERQYFYLITCLKSILNYIRSEKREKGKVLLYWEIGNKILNFMESCNKPLFIDSISKSLIRDVGLSKPLISRCRKFRIKYPNLTEIDTEKKFTDYVKIFEKGYCSKNRRYK